MAATANGTANGNGNCHGVLHVFPEALSSLKLADPEVYQIIQDEKARQWCVERMQADVRPMYRSGGA